MDGLQHIGDGPGLRRFLPHLDGVAARTLGQDLVAGLTVAAVAVPQGMAYALVAGVPIEMGLFAAALPVVISALFGSSPYLVTGPTNPVALVLSVSLVAPAVAAGRGVPIDAVLLVALVSGVICLGLGLVGLGRTSRFLSDAVICGIVASIGLVIAIRQIPTATGMVPSLAPESPLIPAIWPILVDAVNALRQADPRTLLLAIGVPGVTLGLRRLDRRIPAALLALAAAAAVASLLGWGQGDVPLGMLEPVTLGWPRLHMPTLGSLDEVIAPALAIAVLSTVQSVAVSRSLGVPTGGRLDLDRELFGIGASNLTAALVGAMPSGGSLTRSALNRRSGARSRAAAAFSGLAVLVLAPVIGPALSAIPIAALAGLVVLTGLDLIRPVDIRRAGATRGDAIVLIATVGTALWIGVVEAIYAGLILSLTQLVRRSGRLQMVEMVQAGSRRIAEIPVDDDTGRAPAVLLQLEGDLNFAVAPELIDLLTRIGDRGPDVMILRLKRARHIDATVLEALRRFCDERGARGTTLALCGLTPDVASRLEATELGRLLGPEGLLRSGTRLFEGLEHAMSRARGILGPRDDREIFRSADPQDWSYEI